MADVKWIKLCTDVFDDEKIILIDALPERDGLLVIWFKLLCLAGKQNNGGVFIMNNRIPYTDEMLSQILRRPLNVVRLALKTFEEFGMIEIVNNTITLPNWEKHQNLQKIEAAKEKTRKRVARHRERQKLLAAGDCNALRNVTVTESNADRIEEDKEKDLEKDIDIDVEAEAEEKPAFADSGNDYNDEDNKLQLFKGRVMLSERQVGDLLEKMGLEAFDEYLDRLNNYIVDNNARIKNHYETILKWYDEDRALRA